MADLDVLVHVFDSIIDGDRFCIHCNHWSLLSAPVCPARVQQALDAARAEGSYEPARHSVNLHGVRRVEARCAAIIQKLKGGELHRLAAAIDAEMKARDLTSPAEKHRAEGRRAGLEEAAKACQELFDDDYNTGVGGGPWGQAAANLRDRIRLLKGSTDA